MQDGKGGVLANQPVRVWLFDNEHINAIDVTTDGSGRYCVDAGIRYCVPWGDDAGCKYTENTISYHVSSPASSDNSSMANPIPANCKQNGGSYPTIQNVNGCSLVKDASSGQGGHNPPVAPVQTASIGACGFCDGRGPGYCAIPGASSSGSCAQLPPVTFTPGKPPTGSTPPTTTAPKPKPTPVCTKTLKAGEACSLATIQTICCPAGYECADRVCVPVSAE